ncbi:PREDICTED: uncharacterized protein LOC109164060 [Ipomoea nil]|uniref:uncharacterized protein LOC109164060 n=1 Tax=Ipomoea nil TaxID=35883 RepID=UPI0009010AB0|nr:PREDICTED: uncharacterized protein LOC109164060 [Ipomoea nil]
MGSNFHSLISLYSMESYNKQSSTKSCNGAFPNLTQRAQITCLQRMPVSCHFQHVPSPMSTCCCPVAPSTSNKTSALCCLPAFYTEYKKKRRYRISLQNTPDSYAHNLRNTALWSEPISRLAIACYCQSGRAHTCHYVPRPLLVETCTFKGGDEVP